jgi:hypothetical protein
MYLEVYIIFRYPLFLLKQVPRNFSSLLFFQAFLFNMKLSTTITASVAIGVARAQVGAYGQCGGTSYSGSTSCTSGYFCTSYNPYYYQCIPGTGVYPPGDQSHSQLLKFGSL